MTEPAIYLITGPMAAGKSTVARLLASRFQRGVHLDAARFRQSIVRGREQTTAGAIDKLGLCQRLAAVAADTYVEAGYTVGLEDAVVGPALGAMPTILRLAGALRGRQLRGLQVRSDARQPAGLEPGAGAGGPGGRG